jgi:hypothetical protein
MSDDLDSFEAEGVQAFTRLTGAVQDFGGRLGAFEHGLGHQGHGCRARCRQGRDRRPRRQARGRRSPCRRPR